MLLKRQARDFFRALVAGGLTLAAADSAAAGPLRLGSGEAVLQLAAAAEKTGDSTSARRLLEALLHDRSANVRAEARFRLAKMLVASGRKREAAVMLRRVVDEHPKAAPARLELAALLHSLGEHGPALKQLRALGTLDLPVGVARFVDRMSAALQASRPVGVQVELALAPDSNINRATRSGTLDTVFGEFTLDEGSRAKSGIGAAVRAFGHGRIELSRDVGLTANASLDANLYRHKQFNDIAMEVSAGPQLRLGKARIGLEGGVGQQWYGMKPFQRSARLTASGWLKVDDVSNARLDLTARIADNAFNDLQDGRGASGSLRYERALSPTLTVGLSARADRFKARDDAYSTRSWSLGALAYRDIGRTTLELGGEIGGLEADERLAILPEAREDKRMRVQAGAVFRQLTVAGFAPTVRVVVERNRSNIPFHDYKRTRSEFAISRAF